MAVELVNSSSTIMSRHRKMARSVQTGQSSVGAFSDILSGTDIRNHWTDYGGNTYTHPKESMPDKAHCIRLLDPFMTLGIPCVRTITKMDAMCNDTAPTSP